MKLQNKLLIGTNNAGKLKEFQDLLKPLVGVEITYPAELGIDLEVDETGSSYIENAMLKAEAFAKASGLVSLADDSGLEVDALAGAPGIYSARYGGFRGSAQHEFLLQNMAKSNILERSARFRCFVAVGGPNGSVTCFEGICEGEIGLIPKGEHGFGYDPLFYMPEYGRTMAELDIETKNKISHRARAVRAAMPFLESIFYKGSEYD